MEASEMFVLFFAILSLIQTSETFIFNSCKSNTPMQDMLDMMQQLMTGGTQFDRNFIKEIRTCMASFDPQLPDVHDSTWQGIIDYWDMGGNSDDPWGKSSTTFAEYNVTVSSLKQMTIYAPCNFASNVAYYNILTELCSRRTDGSEFHSRPEYINALGKMFAALAVGSSFMHATNTKLGIQQDSGIINILAYLMHQEIMESLPYRSPILNDLSPVPRPMTALLIVEAVQKMYSSEPVDKWYKIFDAINMPDYFMGFSGIIITMLHMIFDYPLLDLLITIILDAFGLPSDDQRFLTNDFLPELRRATLSLDRKKIFQNSFFGNSMGAMAKLLYAFVWQETVLINNPIILNPITNMIGLALLPKVNSKINDVTNYQYFKSDFQKGVNIYPGERWCNPRFAHAKWHVQSAVGFLDLTYLADEMTRLLAPDRK